MKFELMLETAILSDDVALKKAYTAQCLDNCIQKSGDCAVDFIPKQFDSPSYGTICRIVDPKDLPSRKRSDTMEGMAALVHAIAHIEYSAIDLALDAVYHFGSMPIEYKIDWLEVAADEIRHFAMLEALLSDLGYKYGDFPVHSGLFDIAKQTAHSPLDRMAVVPRYFEASGLDVNPQIIKKLKQQRQNQYILRLIESLEVILAEEIDHVRKGDRWFKYLCDIEGLDAPSTYKEILSSYRLLDKPRPHINIQARKEAGFACSELLELGAKECGEE
jgi:uncharacterized ferritin-like protein (DUF455 family)